MSRENRGDFPRQVVPLHLEDVPVILGNVDLMRGIVRGAEWIREGSILFPDLQNVTVGVRSRGDGGAVHVFFFHTLYYTGF